MKKQAKDKQQEKKLSVNQTNEIQWNPKKKQKNLLWLIEKHSVTANSYVIL